LGHLQPLSSIAFDVSLPSGTFSALGLSVTEALGHMCGHKLPLAIAAHSTASVVLRLAG
jgi:hypothetical protein